MKRTTIFVPEALERDLQLHARREGKPAAAIVREAIEAYLVAHRPAGRLPSFAAVGASGRSDIARTHEALVFGDLDPHQGTPVPVRP
ncbi:MAG TPA: ribbon-helix-helix protein, CopG family, partial [Vicinamibacterales bacterium]|nr:ribbon-helix-helix protein, CopG family [Vicinamibacterales bacterium]